MAKGISLHIGMNEVDSSHYGSTMPLAACEFDAQDMEGIAQNNGYESTQLLLSSQATVSAVKTALNDAAEQLNSGDIFFISYSGHGGRVLDTNMDENDKYDETWCLYDRQWVDDEIYTEYKKFKSGVRILVVSDSCHSGTVAKFIKNLTARNIYLKDKGFEFTQEEDKNIKIIKALPLEVSLDIEAKHEELYDKIQKDNPDGKSTLMRASLLLLSGCRDVENSYDGDRNGTFTAALREVWNEGSFNGNYISFHEEITRSNKLDPRQNPQYTKEGVPNAKFEMMSPFSV